ncbi:hypothetical protein BG003_000622 [Podila horticola]|nr:hypothetical protein BG003_000622 [Podila horticola]
MKFITIAITIFAVASATTQAVPALHKRSGSGLVNVQDVPVIVKVEDVANNLLWNGLQKAKILSRALVTDTKLNILKEVNVLSKNDD